MSLSPRMVCQFLSSYVPSLSFTLVSFMLWFTALAQAPPPASQCSTRKGARGAVVVGSLGVFTDPPYAPPRSLSLPVASRRTRGWQWSAGWYGDSRAGYMVESWLIRYCPCYLILQAVGYKCRCTVFAHVRALKSSTVLCRVLLPWVEVLFCAGRVDMRSASRCGDALWRDLTRVPATWFHCWSGVLVIGSFTQQRCLMECWCWRVLIRFPFSTVISELSVMALPTSWLWKAYPALLRDLSQWWVSVIRECWHLHPHLSAVSYDDSALLIPGTDAVIIPSSVLCVTSLDIDKHWPHESPCVVLFCDELSVITRSGECWHRRVVFGCV